MVLARVRLALAALCMTLLAASTASAQVFGTFSWQMQPYCNIVTLTITQIPGGYTIDGNDNQCGVGGKLAGAAGMALLNPDGTVGLEFTIVTAPSGKAVHVSASISPATGSGPWTDSVGNTGNFALGSPGSGSPRPLPASGVGPASITATEIAAAAIGAAQLATNAVTGANVVNGSLTSADLADGPRAEFSSGDQAVTLTGAAAIVRSVTITAPVGGKVLVNASGYVWASAAVAFTARCSITTGSTLDFSHLIYLKDTTVAVADSDAFGAARGFTVPAGAFTVNLVCDVASGNAIVSDTSLTALFVAQ